MVKWSVNFQYYYSEINNINCRLQIYIPFNIDYKLFDILVRLFILSNCPMIALLDI